ncbi:MAG: D-alanyl-D-alanine endopeptidase [Pseudomonadales bacterium]|nr:D-alanyl-D-alanine endopeptidase [Pseudomonadales bacterium]
MGKLILELEENLRETCITMPYRSLLSLIVCLFLGISSHVQASLDPNSKITTASLSADTSKIQLGAVKAAVMDLDSGEVLYSKYADWVTPIASITKVMTAMVVLDSEQSLDEMVVIAKPDYETRKNAYSRMRIGSKLKRSDLVRLSLMASENLAAYTLSASYPGGVSAFVEQMNKKADELGMTKTQFADASGLSINNVSTADDLLKMIKTAAEYEKIREYSTTPRYTARFKGPRYSLNYGNTNRLVHRNSWNIGLSKTGYLTEAGRCLVLLSEFEGRPVAMVLLDAFGKITPLGDAQRVKRWLTTGDSGRIAGAALRYQQSKSKEYPY